MPSQKDWDERKAALEAMDDQTLVREGHRSTGIHTAIVLHDLQVRGRDFTIAMILSEERARGRI